MDSLISLLDVFNTFHKIQNFINKKKIDKTLDDEKISNNIQQLIAFILLCILIFGCTPK